MRTLTIKLYNNLFTGEGIMSNNKNWYISAIAIIYFCICLPSFFRMLHFKNNGAIIPTVKLVICIGMAATSALYFYKPKLGHLGLLLLPGLTLIRIGESDAEAFGFHLVVFIILLIPIVKSNSHNQSVNQSIQGTL